MLQFFTLIALLASPPPAEVRVDVTAQGFEIDVAPWLARLTERHRATLKEMRWQAPKTRRLHWSPKDDRAGLQQNALYEAAGEHVVVLKDLTSRFDGPAYNSRVIVRIAPDVQARRVLAAVFSLGQAGLTRIVLQTNAGPFVELLPICEGQVVTATTPQCSGLNVWPGTPLIWSTEPNYKLPCMTPVRSIPGTCMKGTRPELLGLLKTPPKFMCKSVTVGVEGRKPWSQIAPTLEAIAKTLPVILRLGGPKCARPDAPAPTK